MGPRIEGGHDDVGTGPERARPRIPRVRDGRRRRGARRQRKSQGTSEGREPAPARAYEGEQAVEVLSEEKSGRHGVTVFSDRDKWDLGSVLETSLQGWLLSLAGALFFERERGKERERRIGRLYARICFFYTPRHPSRETLERSQQ